MQNFILFNSFVLYFDINQPKLLTIFHFFFNRNCREFYERRVRMAEIASQRWGDKGNKTNLVQQGQTSPNSLNSGEEPMIITTSDVTSSISSSSRDDSTSSYKESSANSSDHESSSHPVLPILPPSSSLSSSIITGDKLKNDAGGTDDMFVEKPFLKCATLPNRKSSSTKTNDMRTSTMLKKVLLFGQFLINKAQFIIFSSAVW